MINNESETKRGDKMQEFMEQKPNIFIRYGISVIVIVYAVIIIATWLYVKHIGIT